jgi:hypothetical protein
MVAKGATCESSVKTPLADIMLREKTTTQRRSRDELGGAKAQKRTASTPFLVLGSVFAFFPGRSLQQSSLQAAPRHKPIAFDPEGSSLDRTLASD